MIGGEAHTRTEHLLRRCFLRLSILAIGKMKKGPERELLERYCGRASKVGGQLGLSGPVVQEWNESRAASSDKRKEEEAAALLAGLKPGAYLIVLDENGKDLTSPQLAERIEAQLGSGAPEIAFAIGGPDGHGQALLDRADLVLRMGRLTWPHQVARVLLSEQIYRILTILSGHPYHRN